MKLVAFTQSKDVRNAVLDIKDQLNIQEDGILIYYVSTLYNQALVAKIMYEEMDVTCVGASSYREYIQDTEKIGSIVAMFVPSSKYKQAVIKKGEVGIDIDIRKEVEIVVAGISNELGKPALELEHDKYLGYLLNVGTGGFEDEVIEAISDNLDIVVAGGSASDNMEFKETFVHLNGNVYNSAFLLLVLEPINGFQVFKTESFVRRKNSEVLKVTKIEGNRETGRVITELNDKPAVEEYARILGVNPEELGDTIIYHPLALDAGEEFFVRSVAQVLPDNQLYFAASMIKDIDYILLDAVNMKEDTKESLELHKVYENRDALILQHMCAFRTLQLGLENATDNYTSIFKDTNMIGISSFGEQYVGHVNQTSTFVVIY